MLYLDTATTVFESIGGNCPEYWLHDIFVPAQQMHNHQTRHAQNILFPFSIIKCDARQRSFSNSDCYLWNPLPHSLEDANIHMPWYYVLVPLLSKQTPTSYYYFIAYSTFRTSKICICKYLNRTPRENRSSMRGHPV